MNNQQAKELLKKYNNGTASEDEKSLVESWFLNLKSNQPDHGLSEENIDRNTDEVWSSLQEHLPKRSVRLWSRIAVAASVVLIASLGFYFYNNQLTNKAENTVDYSAIAPGKNGATLTLADGRKILINDALAGNIATQSGVKISKTAEGQIVYEVTADNSGANAYNTLTTTRGQQSQVRLPDGTVVFLNAESSLRYPTSFAKSAKREVSLSGEGYFEVFKDKSHPFRVSTADQVVEVLGTHFNINAYENSQLTRTTLVEGSVKVSVADQNVVLRPNQEAVLNDKSLKVAQVDAELVLAWKNGFFLFSSEPLESIMDKVARWYNVEVSYANPALKTKKFTGTLDRSEDISKVIELLESTGSVKFKVSGKKLMIEKNNK